MSSSLENKKIFLVATRDKDRGELWAQLIRDHYSQPTIFMATDGSEASMKFTNAPPHVLITDLDLPKQTGETLIRTVLSDRKYDETAIVILEEAPDKDLFVDEVVIGRVQFLADSSTEDTIIHFINKALNWVSHNSSTEFKLLFLSEGDVLFSEGDPGDFVYVVRKGSMAAHKRIEGQKKILGHIQAGEFVGEMAHINGEPRSATVVAEGDCELIEIPMGSFDFYLFQRPSWAKALMQTLSKRLKQANAAQAKS